MTEQRERIIITCNKLVKHLFCNAAKFANNWSL